MRVAVLGFDGPVARATRGELERRGHQVANDSRECAIYCPGSLEELEKVAREGPRRLVLRSHASAYGASEKNPGMMTEDRVSLLPDNAPERRWLEAESIVSRHANAAAVRLTNVADADEGDVVVKQLMKGMASPIAGRDPNLQFITVEDAGRALASAAEANATGIFNAAGGGAIPLKKAFKAAGTRRFAIAEQLAGLGRKQLLHNWTVSGERAARELGFTPRKNSVEALRELLTAKPGARPELLRASYDDYGLDIDYIRAWGGWFSFLRNVYWRIDSEGFENVPETGRALYVSNHRGFMPLDAVMHLSLCFTQRRRIIRFLIIHSLLRMPFLSNFLTKLGGVIASQENAARLFEDEDIVGIFPEGIRGAFSPYKRAYELRDFAKTGFAKIAIENQAPVIPAAVVGHAEIFPIIGRIDSTWITKEYGWPYLPIAPMFPLAPVPIPSKWHVRVLPAVPLQGLKPADADNIRILRDFSRHIQAILQRNIDDMKPKRKSIFHGRVLDGTAPPAPPLPESVARAAAGGD